MKNLFNQCDAQPKSTQASKRASQQSPTQRGPKQSHSPTDRRQRKRPSEVDAGTNSVFGPRGYGSIQAHRHGTRKPTRVTKRQGPDYRRAQTAIFSLLCNGVPPLRNKREKRRSPPSARTDSRETFIKHKTDIHSLQYNNISLSRRRSL